MNRFFQYGFLALMAACIFASLSRTASSATSFEAAFSEQAEGALNQDTPTYTGDPYPLETCAVSGEKFAPGRAIVKIIHGREVKFCCGGCAKKYATSAARYELKIDEALIKAQKPYYPLDVCPLMDEPLEEDGKDIAKNVIHGNRLVRLCCSRCVRKFQSQPDALLKKLDGAVRKVQGPNYPLTTCLVDPEVELTKDNTVEVIIGNRLMRVSSKEHAKTLRTAPASYIKRLNGAWRVSGRSPR